MYVWIGVLSLALLVAYAIGLGMILHSCRPAFQKQTLSIVMLMPALYALALFVAVVIGDGNGAERPSSIRAGNVAFFVVVGSSLAIIAVRKRV